MKTYLLSESAKQCEWQVWKHLGGCSLSNPTEHAVGKISPKTTLGELQDRCIVAGRELARFASQNLGMKDWAVVEYDQADIRKSAKWSKAGWIIESSDMLTPCQTNYRV